MAQQTVFQIVSTRLPERRITKSKLEKKTDYINPTDPAASSAELDPYHMQVPVGSDPAGS